MVLTSRRPRTVLGCLVACRGPVRPAGLGAAWLPGPSWGGGFLGADLGAGGVLRHAGLAAPRPPGRCGFLPRGAWPGGRVRVARSPALPRGGRSLSGDAPAAGQASARPPTGRYKRDRQRSPTARHWRPSGPADPGTCRWGCRRPAAGRPGRACRARGGCRGARVPSARVAAKSRSSITTAHAPCCLAVAMRVVTAARSRPSRAVAGRPARSRPIVAGTPRMLPSGATTATARWPWLTSTAATGCCHRSSSDAAATGVAFHEASRYQRSRAESWLMS